MGSRLFKALSLYDFRDPFLTKTVKSYEVQI